MEAKSELRRAIKERLSKMSENDRRVESKMIIREIEKLIPEDAKTFAVYSPYVDEPNITPLLTKWLEQKKVICMGKVDGNRMTMHQIASLDDVHKNPRTTILEPKESLPVDEATVDVAIVPGRAFTAQGDRMGRGNGGYDIWISAQRKRSPNTRFIGVCFDCQLVQSIPMEAHDERMDTVLTPSRVCAIR